MLPTPIYWSPFFTLDPAPPFSKHHSRLSLQDFFTHFHMSKEQQQTLEEYSYQVITLPNPVPLEPHNQATMLRDFSVKSTYHVSLCVEPSRQITVPDLP